MSKIKKLVYSLAVMVFVVVALSSCDKSMDEPVVPQQNAAIYDLQGRRVLKAQKGLYIINGKKVVVK